MTAAERERRADRHSKRELASRWRAVQACTRCGRPIVRFKKCLSCRRKHAAWALAWYHRNKQIARAA